MSAVVSFVSNVVESVVDTVGDAVEAVGNAVESVVETVGDVVQKVIDDPLPTLLSIAGSAIGIPPPVTMAAVTAARGGDLEDIVLSAGTAYIAPQVSTALSSTLSPIIGDVIVNETVSNVVTDGISKGLVNGAIAEVRGGDFDDGFAGGFTGSVVNSSVGEFTNEFIRPEVQDMLVDSGLDVKTVNDVINAGTKAVSAGLSAEITGQGSFDTAFINSVQNSTINAGTNFATNSISDQFKSVESTMSQTEEKTGETEGIMSWNDYNNLETTRDQDVTSAGISDDLVSEVAVSDTGFDTGNATQATNDMWQKNDYQDLIGSSQDVIDQFTSDFSPEETVAETETPEEQIGDTDQDYAQLLPQDVENLFAYTPAEEPTAGGLRSYIDEIVNPKKATEGDVLFSQGEARYAPEEAVIGSDLTEEEKKLVDPYAGLTTETFGIQEEPVTDIVGAPQPEAPVEGGLNAAAQKLAEEQTPTNIGQKAIGTVMNSVVRPAIRQGLTRAIKGTPSRPAMRQPVAKKPATALTPDQLARIRSGLSQQAPQKIDMSKILSQMQKPTYTPAPQKADVTKLTPVTNIASLTALLNRNKG